MTLGLSSAERGVARDARSCLEFNFRVGDAGGAAVAKFPALQIDLRSITDGYQIEVDLTNSDDEPGVAGRRAAFVAGVLTWRMRDLTGVIRSKGVGRLRANYPIARSSALAAEDHSAQFIAETLDCFRIALVAEACSEF